MFIFLVFNNVYASLTRGGWVGGDFSRAQSFQAGQKHGKAIDAIYINHLFMYIYINIYLYNKILQLTL